MDWLPLSKLCIGTPYSAEYLSLLARKHKLVARKVDNIWYSTKEHLETYSGKQAVRSQAQNVKDEFLPLSKLAVGTPYTAEYLSFLARKHKFSARKVENVWYSTSAELERYTKKQKARVLQDLDRGIAYSNDRKFYLQNLRGREGEIIYKKIEVKSTAPKHFRNYESLLTGDLPQIKWAATSAVFSKVLVSIVAAVAVAQVGSLFYTGTVGRSLSQDLESRVTALAAVSGTTASLLDAIKDSADFFANGFENLRNIAIDLSEKESEVVSNPAPPLTLSLQESTPTLSSADLRTELESYIRTQLAGFKEPSQALPSTSSGQAASGQTTNVYNYTYSPNLLRNEILLADTRPTVTRQSNSDVDTSSRMFSRLSENGTFTNPTMTGATVSGPSGSFTSLGFGNATGTTLYLSGDSRVDGNFTVGGDTLTIGQLLSTRVPTLAHVFAPSWPDGASNASDATIYINPASAAADTNIFAAAVAGSVKFLVDAEGDVYARNLILAGSTSAGETNIAGNLTVQDSATFGDATSDTTTFNSQLLALASTTLQNFTFVNATGTSATTTNLFSTTASSTNLYSTNFNLGSGSVGTLTVGAATTTNLFSTTASSTNLFSTSANIGTLTVGPITSSGALSLGTNTITSGLINGQTISSAANFTGTAAIATSLSIAGGTALTTTNQTGTGSLVMATSPTLVTPTIGAATATTINGLTLTPSTGTLSITNLKTLSATNSLVLSGTDGTTLTFPSTSATIARTDAGQTFTGTQVFSSTITGSISGNAATVTTNANLTGPITSVGNATAVASQTGTGSTFVMQASPTLTTPNIGAASGSSLNLGSGAITSGAINGQTISSAASFTGTLTTASTIHLNLSDGAFAINSVNRLAESGAYTILYRDNGVIGMYLGGSDAGNYYDNTTHYFRGASGSGDLMTINSTGVGVGRSPSYRLDVVNSVNNTWTAVINQTEGSNHALLAYGSTYALYGVGPIYGTTTITAGGAISGASLNVGSGAITSGTINGQTISSAASFTGSLTTAGAVNSTSYLYVSSKNALQGTDTWLRLNSDSSFTSGIYTPGLFRATGVVYSDSSFRLTGDVGTIMNSNEFYCNNASTCYFNYDGTGTTYIGNATNNTYFNPAATTYITPSNGYLYAPYFYSSGPGGYLAAINGTLTANRVPRADGSYRITTGSIYDDGVGYIETLGEFYPGNTGRAAFQGSYYLAGNQGGAGIYTNSSFRAGGYIVTDTYLFAGSASYTGTAQSLTVVHGALAGGEVATKIYVNDTSASNEYFLQMIDAGETDNEFLFRTDGTANADGSFTGGGADVAEVYLVDGPKEFGDLVEVDPSPSVAGKEVKVHEGLAYNPNVVGVISTAPGLRAGLGALGLGETEDARNTDIALMGRVPTKVSLENGPIKAGDALTSSSVRGVAMRATRGGIIIGRALEDYDGTVKSSPGSKLVEEEYLALSPEKQPIPDPSEPGVGRIMVFVHVGYWEPTGLAALEFPDFSEAVEAVVRLTSGFKTALIAWLGDTANGIGDFFANRVRTKELCVSDEGGETCITKANLDALLASAGTSSSSSGSTTFTETVIEGGTTSTTGETASSTSSTVAETSATTTEPIITEPAPTPEPTPASEPVATEVTEPAAL